MEVLTHRPGSDEFDDALRGYVRAERINDIFAHPDSKRFRVYLDHCRADLAGEEPIDPCDEYRKSDRRIYLIERALQGYEQKHMVDVTRGRIYRQNEVSIAAAPDGVESDLIGLTVRIHLGGPQRDACEAYEAAVDRGVTPVMYRKAIASMAVSRLPNWIFIDYVEDANIALRRLHEHDVEVITKQQKDDLMGVMMSFARSARLQVEATQS